MEEFEFIQESLRKQFGKVEQKLIAKLLLQRLMNDFKQLVLTVVIPKFD